MSITVTAFTVVVTVDNPASGDCTSSIDEFFTHVFNWEDVSRQLLLSDCAMVAAFNGAVFNGAVFNGVVWMFDTDALNGSVIPTQITAQAIKIPMVIF